MHLSLGAGDFEFMEASGKCLCVPAQQPGFKWTGRAVKQLAGNGAVYVTEEREGEECSSDDSDSLPDIGEKSQVSGCLYLGEGQVGCFCLKCP
jgi:hypothetical protein